MAAKAKKELKKPLTIITTHFNPDYDAVGSMVAARRLYPEALLVFPGGSDKNLRHFFVQSLIHLIGPAKVGEVDLSRVERLVLVDTRQPGRLGELKEVLKNPGLDIHIYDHHPEAPGDLRGSVEVIAPVPLPMVAATARRSRGRPEKYHFRGSIMSRARMTLPLTYRSKNGVDRKNAMGWTRAAICLASSTSRGDPIKWSMTKSGRRWHAS